MPRTIYDELKNLFAEGYTPQDVIALGYSKSTVYNAWKKYLEELKMNLQCRILRVLDGLITIKVCFIITKIEVLS